MDAALKDAYVNWLEGMRWDWWVTPTFRYPKTQAQAVAAVQQWLASKAPHVYAAVAYERGPQGGRLHCHAVVGGIGRHPLQQNHLLHSWRRGIITVEPYTPTKGGVRYMLKQVENADGLEIIGTPMAFKPRKRGRRGGS